jgi:hypothetical protein
MTEKVAPIEMLFKRADDYSKTSIELIKLKTIDKSAEIISSLISKMAIYLAATMSVLVFNIGAALYIGQLLNNLVYGFCVIGIFYALLAVLLFVFKNLWIKNPLNNAIINQMLKHKAA